MLARMASFHCRPALICPSLLASDLSCLAAESNRMVEAGADYLHLDVMDGHFVPNLTFGAPVISCLRKNTTGVLDVHLMVSRPDQWLDDMAAAGADIFTFHAEVTCLGDDLTWFINKIKEKNMKAGLAIKPKTPVEAVYPYLNILDQVLVMTVEPGFGGQSFMHDMMPKVRAVRDLAPDIDIQVDGGLGADTIKFAAEAGANVIVAGTSVFKAPSPAEMIGRLRRIVEIYGNGKVDGELL